ncbi:MAG TPA: hypothetical protein ENN27_04175 [Candidatus Atribacteria bacterium]|nr:hypothetical protein [Candidatus Atribacteria bacterium]
MILIILIGYFVFVRFIFDGSELLQLVVLQQVDGEDIEEDRLITPVDEFADWHNYINEDYGFMMKYSPNYTEVVDTYGWPNSVVHFIETSSVGDQAYRARIEIWNDELGWENLGQYLPGRQPDFRINVDEKYLTVSYEYAGQVEDISIKEDWEKAISSFELIR